MAELTDYELAYQWTRRQWEEALARAERAELERDEVLRELNEMKAERAQLKADQVETIAALEEIGRAITDYIDHRLGFEPGKFQSLAEELARRGRIIHDPRERGPDPELSAVEKIVEALEPLGERPRQRILAYVNYRFDDP